MHGKKSKMKIEFFHEFVPPKTTVQERRQNKSGGYLHNAGRIAKATWRAVLEQYRPAQTLEGPVELTVIITWPHTKASQKQNNGLSVPKTTRPDGDNLVKMIKDVMTLLGYWKDDAQVYSETIERWHGEIPGVAVKIKN